jgi:hypothetical protein
MLSLCTSSPIYLTLVIKGCSFLEKFENALKTYSNGAPFYNVWVPVLRSPVTRPQSSNPSARRETWNLDFGRLRTNTFFT